MTIRFHDSWLEDPLLKDWLVKVSNDESRAYCRWCQIVLRAHKADLTTHSNTAKHAKNTESATLAGVQSTPIFVQIVPNEDQNKGYSDSNSSYAKTPYTAKRFRPEWLEIDELKDWLEPCEEYTKAYCRLCDAQLRAHKHDLVLHGRSTKHKRCAGTLLPSSSQTPTSTTTSNVISVEVENEISNSDLVDSKITASEYNISGPIIDSIASGADVDDELPIKKCRMDMSDSSVDDIHHQILNAEHHHQQDEHDHGEMLTPEPHETIHGDLGDGERDPIEIDKPQIIRVVDKPRPVQPSVYAQVQDANGVYRIGPQNNSSSINRLRGRRPRIIASDVIRAIELNEFTGYEMLQILKKIAPKL